MSLKYLHVYKMKMNETRLHGACKRFRVVLVESFYFFEIGSHHVALWLAWNLDQASLKLASRMLGLMA